MGIMYVPYEGTFIKFISEYNTATHSKITCNVCKENIQINDKFWFTTSHTFNNYKGTSFSFKVHTHCLKEFEANPKKVLFQLSLGIYG